MPELAEVEFFRQRWNPGLRQPIERVRLHARAGVFKTCDPTFLKKCLTGATLLSSETAAKQMLFRASGDAWLGIHLGMTGELTVQPAAYAPQKRDHLVLVQRDHALVFSDFRMFGRIQFSLGADAPEWWISIAPPVLSKAFTAAAVSAFLARRARAPIKAVLLMQERFPGIGNWMADEILWRAALHPKRLAGSLTPAEVRALWRETRRVAGLALDTIAGRGGRLPPDLNVHIPTTWLFLHRWENGGLCPRTGGKLVREQIRGRTTCWSPARQKLS